MNVNRILLVIIMVLSLLVAVDGLGSILIEGGQFHNFWFDLERFLRIIAGLLCLGFAWIVYKYGGIAE